MSSPIDRPATRRLVLLAVALLLATAVAYSPLLQCGFIWDDNDYVTENQTLRDAQGLRDIWLKPSATPQYYPLVHSTFWLEYHAWGLHPTGFHLTNLALHTLNALLLWYLLSHLQILVRGWLLSFLPSIRRSRIGRLDHRTQKRFIRVVLSFGLDRILELLGCQTA